VTEIKQTVTQVSMALFQSSEGYAFNPDPRECEFTELATGRTFNCLTDSTYNPDVDLNNVLAEWQRGKRFILRQTLLWPMNPAWSDGTLLTGSEIALLKDLAVKTGRLSGFPISISTLR
jgi:hypothetical protein